jgi:ADP-ribose pyrophosphatase
MINPLNIKPLHYLAPPSTGFKTQEKGAPLPGESFQSQQPLDPGKVMKRLSFSPAPSEPTELKPLISPDATFPNLQPGTLHKKCTTQGSKGYPDRKLTGPVDWKQPNAGYKPTQFTHEIVEAGPNWADPGDAESARMLRPSAKFVSYEGQVNTSIDGVTPRNPRGRTGLEERGLLGKWGANFAADPIVTRVNPESGKLEMIAIERVDAKQWAIPGGMVDFGEPVSATLSRELAEEALGKEAQPEQVKALEHKFKDMFATSGHEVYAGYVDDPRNTDNAWMETKAVHLHLTGKDANISLVAGDDAGKAQWMELNSENLSKLYASHGDFVGKAVQDWQASSHKSVLSDGTVKEG